MPYALIVAETNPLHYGHTYLIRRAKESGYGVVVLMSASFTQRGLPVVTDKFTRANDLVKNGADVVITHPVQSATSGGEFFPTVPWVSPVDCLSSTPSFAARNSATARPSMPFIATKKPMPFMLASERPWKAAYPMPRRTNRRWRRRINLGLRYFSPTPYWLTATIKV